MTTVSAGILLWRRGAGGIEVFLAHMGGPFWSRRTTGAWSIPKGIVEPGEAELDGARREFAEEIGTPAPEGAYVDLGSFRQRSGKIVRPFALEAEFEIDEVHSSTFEQEWPPRSGRMQSFPEIDDARWVPVDDARELLVAGQVPVLDALLNSMAE